MADLDKMRRYDAAAISEYYRFRFWKILWRALSVVVILGGFVLRLLLDKALRRWETNKSKHASQLRKILADLGPTSIKLGQFLSSRPDLVNPKFLDELTKLRNQLPSFNSKVANQIIEKELGNAPDEIYSYISPEPIAATSLGQVYKARLYTGEDVAVKVQRPQLIPIICCDLYLMRWVAGWIAPWLPINLSHDLNLIVDEFGSKLLEEIDYLNEGRNAEAFSANFADEPKIKVPAIYWRYTSTRVLTLEWIDGIKLTDIERVKTACLDSNNLVSILVSASLRQLLEFGFFHADPHPDNLFAMPDGAISYIDFGMMDQLNQDMKETLVDLVVHLTNKEYDRLADDFVNLDFLTPNVDVQPMVPALQIVFDRAIGDSVGNFNFQGITSKFSEVMYEYPFQVPVNFALLSRSLMTQERLALTLNSDFKIVETVYPYITRRLLIGETESLRRRLIDVLFKDGRFQWQRLENLIRIAQIDQGFNLIPATGLGVQFLMSDEGQFLRQQILAALTEDNRLQTEEVARLWDLVKDDLQPNELFGAAWSALADFSKKQAAALVPAELTAALALRQNLPQLTTDLNPREQEVIYMRFGIGDDKPSSLSEIGRALNLPRERVRQIESKALQKVGRSQHYNRTRNYLESLLGNVGNSSEKRQANIDEQQYASKTLVAEKTLRPQSTRLILPTRKKYCPNLELPEKIYVNQTFDLHVEMITDAALEKDQSFNQTEINNFERASTVQMVLRAQNFDISGDVFQEFSINKLRTKNSCFRLTPRLIGEQEIRLDFYQFDRRIGTARSNITVLDS